ncbi:MAG: calcium-binding protein [Tepidisphaeraceae bacterium]
MSSRSSSRRKFVTIERLMPRTLLAASTALASDGILSITGTDGNDRITVLAHPVLMNVMQVVINDATSSFLLGDVLRVSIDAGAGSDTIRIDGSLDALYLQSSILAGDGNDRVYGSAGQDLIDGGRGNDRLYGWGGDDKLNGNDGNDTIDAGVGNDSVDAGSGNDSVLGNSGSDTLNGEAGRDTIEGGKGNDVIYGGTDDDTLTDRYGTVSIHGGDGSDMITTQTAGEVWGDDGDDRLTDSGKATLHGGTGNDRIKGVGTVYGDEGNDRVQSSDAHGGAGDDLVEGTDGFDFLYGDDGNDALYGGNFNDVLYGGEGDDNLYGGGVGDNNRSDDGSDAGYGQGGHDWFQPDHNWSITDSSPEDSAAQTKIGLDPNTPAYSSGSYSGAVITLGGYNTTVGGWDYGGRLAVTSAGTLTIIGQVGSVAPRVTRAYGSAAIVSGIFNPSPSSELPAPEGLSTAERRSLTPQVVRIPASWQIEKVSAGRDGIMWYRVWQKGSWGATIGSQSFSNVSVRDGTLYYGARTADLRVGYMAVDERSLLLHGKKSDANEVQGAPLNGLLRARAGSFITLVGEGVARQVIVPNANDSMSVAPAWKGARGLYVQGGMYWFDEATTLFVATSAPR